MKYLLILSLLLIFTACNTLSPQFPQTDTKATIHLSKEKLKSLDFKDKELISISSNNKFYYVNKEGKMMFTLTYDNKADEFSDGLARTKVHGKIGFFNRNLEIVLKPVYDFAFPFHNGKAEICTGCKEKKDGEQSMLEGGTWKKIDRDGLVIE